MALPVPLLLLRRRLVEIVDLGPAGVRSRHRPRMVDELGGNGREGGNPVLDVVSGWVVVLRLL